MRVHSQQESADLIGRATIPEHPDSPERFRGQSSGSRGQADWPSSFLLSGLDKRGAARCDATWPLRALRLFRVIRNYLYTGRRFLPRW